MCKVYRIATSSEEFSIQYNHVEIQDTSDENSHFNLCQFLPLVIIIIIYEHHIYYLNLFILIFCLFLYFAVVLHVMIF